MHRPIVLAASVIALLAASADRAAAVDFAAEIQPIFAARCTSCHGDEKQQGKLRLDTPEEIGKFAKLDALLVAGKPDDSELFRRITLPADDRKRMPRGGDPLSEEQVALIKKWIEEGGKFAAVATPAGEPAAEEAAAEPAEPAPRGEDDPELAALPPASAEAIAKIQAAGATVMPLFGDSPLLQVSFAQASSPPGDEALAALAGAADQIVWLNLSKAQLSPAGYAELAKLKNLIQLHLEHSTANDASLANLAGLARLEYLNLYGTEVTDAGLEPLKGLAKLRNLYLWQTKTSYDAAMGLQTAIPGLDVNLGWDHPQVVKVRLAKELETAKKIAEETAAQAATLEQQFNAARETRDQAAKRLKEIEDELKQLDAPAGAEQPAAEEQGDQAEDAA
jgi:mono/diheme cytochrome c family protein